MRRRAVTRARSASSCWRSKQPPPISPEARQEFTDYADAYGIAMTSCKLQKATDEQVAALNQKLDKTLNTLEAVKAAADITEKAAGTARDIVQSQASLDPVKEFSAPVAIALGAVEVAAFAISTGMQTRMDELERDHDATVDALDRSTAVAICMNEAGAQLIGQKAAALRIDRAIQEVSAQLYQFRSMQGNVDAAIDEGLASVGFEQSLNVLPSNADYWLDSNVDGFQLDMRRARRALYLGILGVEYEFQMTSAERGNVLAAQSSEDLSAVLGRVRDGVRRGAPAGGGNPTELRSVLSLKNNVLQLGDRTDASARLAAAESNRPFPPVSSCRASTRCTTRTARTPARKFPSRWPRSATAVSPTRRASRSSAGSRAPSDSGPSTRSSSVRAPWSRPTAASPRSNCASAIRSRASGAPRRPRRRCRSPRRGREPTCSSTHSAASSWTNDATLASLTSTAETNAFSYATIEARLGIDRKTFESDPYTDGASTALAGRGAFGEYTLFIPSLLAQRDRFCRARAGPGRRHSHSPRLRGRRAAIGDTTCADSFSTTHSARPGWP